ncbi:MAG TPA: ParB N-terminal domain-containing protein [Gallicola sp.]|nr:ParB N-terminal domain-containing protein [Gallicola sp.]
MNIDINKLKPYKNNPRKNDEAVEYVANSIKEFGFKVPIIVDKDYEIIAGHTRLKAAQQLGLKEVPIIIADDLTEEQVKAFRLADNKVSEIAEWDFDLLDNELSNILDIDMSILGFDVFEEEQEIIEDDFEIELPKEPKAKLGDIYQLGNHRLMCGDSTKEEDVAKLMNGNKADMVFTDPPYGISFKDEKGNEIKNDDLNDEKLLEFNTKWQKNAFEVAEENCFMMVWQSPRKFHFLDLYGKWKIFRLITMYKSNRISFPHGMWINKTEPCIVFTKGKPKITEKNYIDDCYVYKHDKETHEDSNVGHPTPKPVNMIIENVVGITNEQEVILDLFGGSGSLIMACERTNRIGYSMELDPHYIDVIINRWENFTGDKAVLIERKENE